MDIYIHKDVLGFQNHHLVCHEGKINRVKEIPDEGLLVYGEPELVEISKLHGVQLPTFPPKPQIKALQSLMGAREALKAPWHLTMPPSVFKRAVKGLAEELTASYSNLDLTYYQTHYRRTMPVLNKMVRAKIDPRAWMVHQSNPELVNPHVMKTFQPDQSWFADKVVYSKSDTKTGRLKVISGPNILHLPKEQRNVLASRFGSEGKIMYLDYSSLEPRVVLFIRTPSLPLLGNPPFFSDNQIGPDIYQSVLTSLNITNISRDSVKDVVLSQLYGAGYDTIVSKLSGIRDPEGFIGAVNDFFGLDDLKQRLLQEWEASGRKFIINFFGRRIDASDAKPYMFLNYYIQSTAVDIALYGFQNIVRSIQNNPLILPLFILHDALVLDVHSSQMELLATLCEVGSKNIPNFPGYSFPLKVARF